MATRIQRASNPLPALPSEEVRAARAARAEPPEPGNLDKIKEMIPGESTALYVGGLGVIPAGQTIAVVVWTLVGLAITILVKAQQKDPRTLKPVKTEWNQIIVAAVAFVIWVYALGDGPFELFGLRIPWAATLLILGYTALSPWILVGLDKLLKKE